VVPRTRSIEVIEASGAVCKVQLIARIDEQCVSFGRQLLKGTLPHCIEDAAKSNTDFSNDGVRAFALRLFVSAFHFGAPLSLNRDRSFGGAFPKLPVKGPKM